MFSNCAVDFECLWRGALYDLWEADTEPQENGMKQAAGKDPRQLQLLPQLEKDLPFDYFLLNGLCLKGKLKVVRSINLAQIILFFFKQNKTK